MPKKLRVKRDEAIERKNARDKRSAKEQISILQNRPGNSSREIKRLEKK